MAKESNGNQKAIAPKFRKLLKTSMKILYDHDVSYVGLYVFGSVARGDARKDSDIDLCLIVDDKHPSPISVQRKATALIGLAGIPADIVAVSSSDFKNDMVSPLLHEIRTDGIYFKRK
jgi:predicted nucleotidyltransferase